MNDDSKKGGAPPRPEWRVAGGTGSRGAYACRPGRVLVRRAAWEARADGADERIARRLGVALQERRARRLRSVVVLEGAPDVRQAITVLRAEGIEARPDHVFFAVSGRGSVSSAPVMFSGVHGAPVMFSGVHGAPVMFSGVHGAPVMFSGVGGAPVMFSAGGCGCGCSCPSPTIPGSPPEPRRSTVRRADAPAAPEPDPPAGTHPCKVVVVDTGLAADGLVPARLGAATCTGLRDYPDADADDQLDAATGHATFIAGIVQRLAPGATVTVRQVLTTFGDASDEEVAETLLELLDDKPDVVNLSFAGYSDDDTTPPAIAEAVAELLAEGVVIVAAAGNDGTCRPAYPAAIDGVIAVGALDDHAPAWFTNHGNWVQTCAPGVDVLAPFFDYAAAGSGDPAKARPTGGDDNELQPDESGWARWSGTSFAAPIVAGALARRITDGAAPAGAVRSVVEDPDLFRIQGLGTVVNLRPW
jgi:subtilisin family serine protease